MKIRDVMLADPLLAAGAGSFSAGMEALERDGFLDTPQHVAETVQQIMMNRWNTFDRVFLCRAWGAVGEDVEEVDRLVEMSTLGKTARDTSVRAGLAMLGVWERLNDLSASSYKRNIESGSAIGHLSVVQALVYRQQGLSLQTSESLSCWALISSLVSATLRLGRIGHREGQKILLGTAEVMEPLLERAVRPMSVPKTWTPIQDIAVERHSHVTSRLFAS